MIHPEVKLVFDYLEARFPGHEFALIGSAVRNFGSANDIDILIPHTLDYKRMAAKLGRKYNGWDTERGHVRRIDIQVRAVGKKVQLLQVDTVPDAAAHPYAAQLMDGTILKPGQFFDKHNI